MKVPTNPRWILWLLACWPIVATGDPPELPDNNDWLLSAESDEERFRRLQRQLRGFDQPMWEVGERFESLHDALLRNNFDLALYHWDKIATTIRNGIFKRPGRAPNARDLFLDEVHERVREGLETREPARAWEAFDDARAACIGCHVAEDVAYMNDQALFDLQRPRAKPADGSE